MRPFNKAVFAVAATVAFFGHAGLSPAKVDSVQASFEAHGDPAAIPRPIVGRDLFSIPQDAPRDAAPCVAPDRILEGFALDIENVGGEIVILADGVQQEFADTWRRMVDEDPVAVSMVLVHVVPNRGGDPIADVVEIDSSGCALSRTLLTADDWMSLVEVSQAVEV